MINAIMMHPDDDVTVVTSPVSEGDSVTYICDGKEITVKSVSDIPVYHKIALRSVHKGGTIRKYGEVIGYATEDIALGSHVHTHNLTDLVEKAGE